MCQHDPNFYFHFYSIPNGDTAGLLWSLNPPIGSFNGPNTGKTVLINFDFDGPTQLCATPTNPCYDPTPICMDLDVDPLPIVNHPPLYNVCDGDHVFFELTGTGTYYSWGLQPWCHTGPPGNVIGDMDFIASNPNNHPISCIMTLVAYNDPNCFSYPSGFTFTIHPRPKLTTDGIDDITVCGGEQVLVPFTGVHNTGYSWTNSNPAIGLPAAGVGNINFTAAKVPQTQTATVTVSPTTQFCTGDPVTFTITVQGSSVDPPPDITVCAGDAVSVPFTGNAAEGYTWTNNLPAIGLDGSGTGNIAFTAQGGSGQQVATVTVSGQPCPFASRSFTITVRPKAVAGPIPDTTICAGDTLALAITGSPGTLFEWTNSNPAIGLPAAGNSPNLLVRAPAAVDSTIKGTVVVTPTRQGCTGQPDTFVISVKKCCATTAGVLDTATITVCGPDKIIGLPLPAGLHLEPGDTLRFALYSNPADPLGSVIQYSDTLLFVFLPGSMHLDSTYFVAALAGPPLAGDSLLVVDTTAKCVSVAKGQKVRWVKKPAMTVAALPDAVCGDGCADVVFDLVGTPPFEFTWQVWQDGQLLLSRNEVVAAGHQHTVTVCPQDFGPRPPGSAMTSVRVVWLQDWFCGCGD
ncbi:MAG: hypothetical protein ABMA02_05390 [Saprospiraceae bacterium]